MIEEEKLILRLRDVEAKLKTLEERLVGLEVGLIVWSSVLALIMVYMRSGVQ